MNKILGFGEKVKGYNIPVLNEREIRAGAGILFFFLMVAIMNAALKMDFTLLKYFIMVFLADFIIRVFINPKFAPTLILGRFFVRKQVPEYVGAPQKKFAWVFGLILAITMLIHINILNGYSPITGIICMICIIFLFFEAAFGICLGCKFYKWYYKENAQYCPGEVCEIQDRHDIQKTSASQWLMVVGFAAYIFFTVWFLHDTFKQPVYDIFGLEKNIQEK